MKGLLLGVSTSLYCFMTCIPVLLPLLIRSGGSIKGNIQFIGMFLTGRLLGYITFALAVWSFSHLLFKSVLINRVYIKGCIYIIIAIVLLTSMASKFLAKNQRKNNNSCKRLQAYSKNITNNNNKLLPVLTGFLFGINLCPPFVALLFDGITQNTLSETLILFLLFFTGTAVIFIPLPFIGKLKINNNIQFVGSISLLIVSVFYLTSGILVILGGII